MALIAEETIAKSAGDLYLAPDGTAAPPVGALDDREALEALGYIHVGWMHEDGPEIPETLAGSWTKLFGWNRTAAVRSVQGRPGDDPITVSLLQWNVETLQLYFPGADYDDGTRTLKIGERGATTHQTFLLTVADGDRLIGLWVQRVSARGGGALSFPNAEDGFSPVPVAFDVLSSDTADHIAVIGVDMAGQGPDLESPS